MNTNGNRFARQLTAAFLVVFVLLVGGHTLNARGLTRIQTNSTTLQAGLKTSEEAKLILSNMGGRDFKQVRNAKMRNAASRALAALKALANNTSRAREATLVANFARSMKTLKALAQPGSTNFEECDKSYELCIELCKETGGNCDLCGISQNGCYLNKLAIEMTKNPQDPTP